MAQKYIVHGALGHSSGQYVDGDIFASDDEKLVAELRAAGVLKTPEEYAVTYVERGGRNGLVAQLRKDREAALVRLIAVKEQLLDNPSHPELRSEEQSAQAHVDATAERLRRAEDEAAAVAAKYDALVAE